MNTTKYLAKTERKKKWMNALFIAAVGFLMAMLIASLLLAGIYILGKDKGTVFEFAAVAIIVLWMALLIGYYSWAIYYYNINLGLTNEDWADIRVKQYTAPGSVRERRINPHHKETLGLPPGTVRGTLTLTLLVTAVAMSIAYMGEDSALARDQFFIDNFDFFKQAFLMMIAFYFGSKSLEYITRESKTGQAPGGAVSPEPIEKELMEDEELQAFDVEEPKPRFTEEEFDPVIDGEIDFADPDFEKGGSVG